MKLETIVREQDSIDFITYRTLEHSTQLEKSCWKLSLLKNNSGYAAPQLLNLNFSFSIFFSLTLLRWRGVKRYQAGPGQLDLAGRYLTMGQLQNLKKKNISSKKKKKYGKKKSYLPTIIIIICGCVLIFWSRKVHYLAS